MAVNPMQRKARNSFLLGVIITLIICGIIIVILVLTMLGNKKKEEEVQIQQMAVTVLNRDVRSGEKIMPEYFNTIIMPTDFIPVYLSGGEEGLINDSIFYYENSDEEKEIYAKVNIAQGTIMTTSLVYEEKPLTKDIRIQQYNMLVLQPGLEIGDYIDIRFMLPTGDVGETSADYLVAARKKIVDISATTIWLEMSEQEILTMSSAIYENYIIKGSALYTVVYVDPGLQGNEMEENNRIIVTYPVSSHILNIITTDPNIVNRAIEGLGSERARLDQAKLLYADDILSNVDSRVADQIKKSQEERKKYWDELYGGY